MFPIHMAILHAIFLWHMSGQRKWVRMADVTNILQVDYLDILLEAIRQRLRHGAGLGVRSFQPSQQAMAMGMKMWGFFQPKKTENWR